MSGVICLLSFKIDQKKLGCIKVISITKRNIEVQIQAQFFPIGRKISEILLDQIDSYATKNVYKLPLRTNPLTTI